MCLPGKRWENNFRAIFSTKLLQPDFFLKSKAAENKVFENGISRL